MKKSALIVMTMLFSQLGFAQSTADPDWPCIQVLIPEISAASIWDGPSVEDINEAEQFEESSRELVFAVVEKHEPLTDENLDSYISQYSAEQRNPALTYLFGSLLKRFNDKRRQQISTIKRYTRTQIKSAETIENLMDQKAEFESQQVSSEQIDELESKLHWQKRMFKERERAFNYLCELPQEIAQQAGEAARTISAKLDY